jgi:hypothetical protein
MEWVALGFVIDDNLAGVKAGLNSVAHWNIGLRPEERKDINYAYEVRVRR